MYIPLKMAKTVVFLHALLAAGSSSGELRCLGKFKSLPVKCDFKLLFWSINIFSCFRFITSRADKSWGNSSER